MVYTGAEGTQWRVYPTTYRDTYENRPYRADRVLSTAGGHLVFDLDYVDGIPAGANPSPVLPGGGMRYGRFEARMKVEGPAPAHYLAWLLWPTNEVWEDGEVNFPEGRLSSDGSFYGANHIIGRPQDAVKSPNFPIDYGNWHTYVIEWTPGAVRLLRDGVVMLHDTENVPQVPMRWQLQTETQGSASPSQTRLLVDYVDVKSWVSGEPAAPSGPGEPSEPGESGGGSSPRFGSS